MPYFCRLLDCWVLKQSNGSALLKIMSLEKRRKINGKRKAKEKK
jgi:hypothetical protein